MISIEGKNNVEILGSRILKNEQNQKILFNKPYTITFIH